MRRKFFMSLAASAIVLAQPTRKKFYITGFYHSKDFNDCTVPPIVAYGADRTDALLRCCENGGITVWTQEEYEDLSKRLGKEFKASCATAKEAK